ncbi:MAG: signal peptide peptidase SppA [Bacteroidales bacterium]|nr:signal peptide peptidase SppA [Bacteroidales bacterium]
MEKQKQPLGFGKTMLASALGVLVMSVVCGLIAFIVMIAMVVSLAGKDGSDAVVVKPGSVLVVDLGKIGGDRTPSGLALTMSGGNSVGLVDAVHAIRVAAEDDNIAVLYLTDGGLSGLSWGSLTELRDALEDFRSSGKRVVAYATVWSQGGYYVASVADSLCLHPSGMVDFRGMGAEVMYYKDLLDKLGVEMQLIRPESCAYKSAGEVYTLNHMSAANREQIRAYISSIWNVATEAIATSRHIGIDTLNAIADNLSGYMADDAQKRGLVDKLCFEEDVRKGFKEAHGGKRLLPVEDYARNFGLTAKRMKNQPKDKIALIYAEGNVVDGSARGMAQGVYGDDIVKALRQASDDNSVKAIVLRVNSPGGQATASESMTYAVRQAREKKPVIVSMGDLAASAGYEMSCLADVIVAQPTTITGSIGVFGTVPNMGRLMRQKLGLNTDTVATNRNATGLSIMRPLSPAAMAMMERNVEDFYKVFVGRVAEGRHMTYDDVHRIARGRVWTGVDAKRIGLVDTLGGIDLALGIAAEKAGVESYAVKAYPEEKDVWTQLQELFGDAPDSDLNLLVKGLLAYRWKTTGKTQKQLSRLEQDLLFVGESEGLQARIPFVVVSE